MIKNSKKLFILSIALLSAVFIPGCGLKKDKEKSCSIKDKNEVIVIEELNNNEIINSEENKENEENLDVSDLMFNLEDESINEEIDIPTNNTGYDLNENIDSDEK